MDSGEQKKRFIWYSRGLSYQYIANILAIFFNVISGTCSHTRSYMFFTESIRTKIGFYARQCNSWSDYKKGHCKGSVEDMILMGEHVNTR